jgi:hypothetical protein
MLTPKKEDSILNDVRRLFVNTRSYPKCFHTNANSTFIYDLINEKYPHIQPKNEVKYLYSLYTLILCGLSSLKANSITKEKILLRFSRFLNIEGSSSWGFLNKMLKTMMNKDLDFFQKNLAEEDFENFKKKHGMIEKNVLGDLKKYLDDSM